MSSTFGTGGVTILNAVGKQDTIINNSENSYFKSHINQQNKFVRNYTSVEKAYPPLDDGESWPFNNEVVFKIDPKASGDLLTNMYLQLELPGIDGSNPHYGVTPVESILSNAAVTEEEFGGVLASYANTLVVSSGFDTYTANVYIFSEYKEFWTPVARFSNTDAYGYSLAVNSDTIAVSQIAANTAAGYVYLYDHAGVEQHIIQPTVPTSFDFFGSSVSMDENHLAVGAYGDTSSTGAVYIFDPSTGSQLTKFTGSGTTTNSLFGFNLHLKNGTLVVSSHQEDSNDGVVYVFTGSGASWSQQARITSPVTGTGSYFFGKYVTFNNSYYFASGGTSNVHVYDSSYSLDRTLSNYGLRVTNTDNKLFIHDSGGCTLFDNSLNVVNKLVPPGADYVDTFGMSVTSSGGYIYMSSPRDSFNGYGSNAGAVYVYTNVKSSEYTTLYDLPPSPYSNVWTDRIGRSLIEYCSLEVDGTVLETIDDYSHVMLDDVYTNEQFRVLRNLTQNGGIVDDVANIPSFGVALPINYKKDPNTGGIGYFTKNNIGQNIFLDLRFFFSRNYNPLPGSKNFNSTSYSHIDASFGTQPNFNNYFPLCAITNEYLYLRVKFRPVEWFTNFPYNIKTSIKLITEQITVSDQERLFYMNTPLIQSYTFTERQYSGPFNKRDDANTVDSELTNRHKLYSSGKLKQFMWFVQNKKYQKLTDPSNDYLFLNRYNFSSHENENFNNKNFGGSPNYEEDEELFPLLSDVTIETGTYDIRLSAGGNQQTQNSSKYFRNIDGPIRGLHIPLRNIYTYSFDPDPKVYMESGFENTSIQKSTEEYTLENTLINTPEVLTANLYNLFIYNRVTRTLRFENGFCMFTE